MMANTVVAGLQPYRVLGGGTVAYVRGRVLTNNTTAIFQYDTVVPVTTGDWIVTATGTTYVGNVQAGGAVYTDANGVRRISKYLPAATLYTSTGVAPDNASYIFIVDDILRVQFLASVDAAIALTDLNLNYAVTLGTGSTVTGLSGHKLTATGRNTTATIPIRVKDFVLGDPSSDPDLADAKVICQINCDPTTPATSASLGF
jgi:hypothetical protein